MRLLRAVVVPVVRLLHAVDRGFAAGTLIRLAQKSPECAALEILILKLHIYDDELLPQLCDRFLNCRSVVLSAH